MKEKIEGLFLSSHPYTDNSIIVQLFTHKYGRKSFIFKGVRRKNSPYIFQPFHFIEFFSNFKIEKSINSASQHALVFPCHQTTNDIRKTSVAIFLTEILNRLLKEGDSSASMYLFIKNSFLLFEIQPFNPCFHLVFLAQLFSFLGIDPKNNWSEINKFFSIKHACFTNEKEDYTIEKDASKAFSLVLGTNIDKFETLHFNKTNRAVILEIVFDYLAYHFNFNAKQISSHKVFKTIFS
ncbi:MAG: DNA repair protein RecO [Parvicellaceae bacterium]